MIYQSDKELGIPESNELCYEFAVLRGYEIFSGIDLTHSQVRSIHALIVDQDYIRKDGYLYEKAIQGIAQIASVIGGKSVYMRQVAEGDNYNFLIARFSRTTGGNKFVYHFAPVSLVDKKTVLYDPWSAAGSKTCREGKIDGYRWIFGEAI